jgi:hypothetical protein
MLEELHTAGDEYGLGREQFETSKIRFDAARERFAGVRRLAATVLSPADWWMWRTAHRNVRYAGLKIGEAIVRALEDYAFDAALRHLSAGAPFDPAMTREEIAATLEEGGFEFRSSAVLREVNAALIHLPNIHRRGKNRYEPKGADKILEVARPISEEMKREEKRDGVPF